MAAVMSETRTLPPAKPYSEGQGATLLPVLSSVTGPSGAALGSMPRRVSMKVTP